MIPFTWTVDALLFVTVTVLAALVDPTATVPKLNDDGEMEAGAVPVPLRVTVCGLVRELSVNESVPDAAPMDVGLNLTPTAQLAPAAIPVPQVELDIANGPVIPMLLKVRGVLSRLVNVTVLAELALPTITELKLKLLVESVTGDVPLPLRLTV